MWIGDYCISCIFQKTSIKNMSYSILAYDDSSPTCTAHYIKNIKDKHTLVDTIFNLANTKIKDEIVNFEIQFLACSSELTNCERKRIMKKHRQNYINDLIEPALKKQKLDTKHSGGARGGGKGGGANAPTNYFLPPPPPSFAPPPILPPPHVLVTESD